MVSQSETAGLELSSLVLLHRASTWFGVPMSLRGKRHVRPVAPSTAVHSDAAARAGRAGAGGRGGEGVARAGRHRSGQRRLRDPRLATGRAGRGATGGAATGHPRRAGRLHARDHPGDPRQPGAGGQLRIAERRAGGQRRHLYALCQPCRGDGARHQPRRRHPGAARRADGSAPTGARRKRTASRWRCHEPQAGQRRRCLYPRSGATARAQCRMGRTGGA